MKKKLKILIIAGRFFPTPTANTINVMNIINELQSRGHQITCIGINQDQGKLYKISKSIPVYSIKSTNFGRLLQLRKENKINILEKIILYVLFFIRRVRNLINFLKFPDVDPQQSKLVFNLAEKLHSREKFDCVIGVFRPFSAVSAVISMKRKYPDLLCGAYYLDLISGGTKPSFISSKFYKKLSYRGELKAFEKLDFILMAKGGESIYRNDEYKSVNSKIRFVDFPVFIPIISKNISNHNDPNQLNFVYAGTLDKNYRNPTYMLEILEKISKKIEGANIVLHLYGRGNCDSIIKKFKNKNNYEIIEYGMVTHNRVMEAMEKADFLINISNKTKNIVPSKIFELFSTGKPILNFISTPEDYSTRYFDKYEAVFSIYEWEEKDNQLDSLVSFLFRERGKKYSIEKIKESFMENTPEYTVDILEDCFELGFKK